MPTSPYVTDPTPTPIADPRTLVVVGPPTSPQTTVSGLDTGIPSASLVNRVAEASPERRTVAAEDTPIPVTWGRDRVFGKVAGMRLWGKDLYILYTFGLGPIEEYETILVDGVDIDSTGGLLSVSNIEIERFTGAANQSVSSLLTTAIPGYEDTLDGIAYVVLKIPPNATNGFPRLEAILKGQKVYDPRKSALGGGDILRLAIGRDVPSSMKTESMTVESWFRIRTGWEAADSDVDIVDNTDRSNEGWLLSLTEEGQIKFSIYTDSSGGEEQMLTTSLSSPLQDGAMHHVAATYDSSSGGRVLRIYIDAEEVATSDISGESFSDWDIHWDSNSDIDLEFGVGGLVDIQDVRIWSDERTSSEIASSYRHRLEGDETGLVGYWPIYESSGTSVEDYSGNHDMTLHSSAEFVDSFKGLVRADTSALGYSENPTLCFADLITRYSDYTIDYDSVIEGADANDEEVGGAPRREVGWTVNTPLSLEDHIQMWRVYMGAFVAWEKGEIRVIPSVATVGKPGALSLNGAANTWATISNNRGISGDSVDLVFRLTTTDSDGEDGSDTVTVTVDL